MRSLIATLLYLLIATAANASDGKLDTLEERVFKQAAALADPSIVRIETVGGLEQLGETLLAHGPTTGVVVSADGYIITSSFNFLAQPNSILVTLPDGRRLAAKLIANDRLRLLTLLKVDVAGLIPAKPAPKSEIVVGQWAIALGRTLENSTPSLSVGIVSALNRVWGKAIQTDAKTSPVNYGGALIDIEGRALGVIAPLSPSGGGEMAGVEWYDGGIGFAIPMDDIYTSVDRLRKGDDLLPGVMGITFTGGQQANVPAIIDRVRFNSPAQKAGLQVRDQIVEVEGEKIVRIAQFKNVTGRKYAGDALKLTVKRGEQSIPIELELVGKLVPYEIPFLGILPQRSAADAGAAVRFVFPSSPAESAGLTNDDRITKFNGVDVKDAASLTDLVSRGRPGDRVTVTYLRNRTEKSVEVVLGSLPNEVVDPLPTELNVEATNNPEQKPADEKKGGDEKKEPETKTGRFTETLAGYDHEYWAYVPEEGIGKSAFGLVVWIHPPGDLMESIIMKQWKTICDRRHLILIAPKADKLSQWTPGESEFIKGLIDDFRKKYTIDANRIVVHSHESGTPMAWLMTAKYRELVRATVVTGAGFAGPAPENEPVLRQQFFFVCGEEDKALPRVLESVEGLRKLKMPVILRQISGLGPKYPAEQAIDEIGRWVDSLDRI